MCTMQDVRTGRELTGVCCRASRLLRGPLLLEEWNVEKQGILEIKKSWGLPLGRYEFYRGSDI